MKGRTLTVGELCDALNGANADEEIYLAAANEGGTWRPLQSIETDDAPFLLHAGERISPADVYHPEEARR